MGQVRGLPNRDQACRTPAPLVTGYARRAVPCLYSDIEVAALMIAAGTLRYPMAVATYRTLIGLLAVTGLRIGEAARLDDTDFDLRLGLGLGLGLLTVRVSKNGRSRQLPLHPMPTRLSMTGTTGGSAVNTAMGAER